MDISGIYLSCSLGTQYLNGSAQSGSADELMEAGGLAAGIGASLLTPVCAAAEPHQENHCSSKVQLITANIR